MRYALAALALMGAAAPASATMMNVTFSGVGVEFERLQTDLSGSFWYDDDLPVCGGPTVCRYDIAIHDFRFNSFSSGFLRLTTLTSSSAIVLNGGRALEFDASMADGTYIQLTFNTTRPLIGGLPPTADTPIWGDDGAIFISVGTIEPDYFLQGLISAYTIAPAPVPEPATWAMMLVGFGVVGASLRGRKAPLAA